MKRKMMKGLTILLGLALALGLFVVGRQTFDYLKGQKDYNEAEQLAKLPQTEEAAAPSAETVLKRPAAEDPYAAMLKKQIDLPALQEVNTDVLGWIEIPDTEISYPLLQFEDNQYYLNHTWKKEENSVGSIYLECMVDPELGDFNTIVYGHRMRNLSMFGSLKFYEDIDYWRDHPSVYVMIDGEAYRYDIYAAYKAAPDDIVYGLGIKSRPKKQEFIQFGLEHSVIDTGVIPTTYDRILTLSTCTGNGHAKRWVVQAVHRIENSDLADGAGAVFEGTDDVADGTAENAGDALTFQDDSDTGKRWEFHLPDIDWDFTDIQLGLDLSGIQQKLNLSEDNLILLLIFVGLALLVSVLLIVIAVLHFLKKDEDGNDDDDDNDNAAQKDVSD